MIYNYFIQFIVGAIWLSHPVLEEFDMGRTNTVEIKDYDEIELLCVQAMVHRDAVDTNE